MKLKVLLADDHALFRDGMRYVLQQLSDEVHVVNAGSFGETLQMADSIPDIDLALMDLDMPGSDGVSSIRIFHARYPGIPIVVISGTVERADIECVMQYGAKGFISKKSSGKEMVSALRYVMSGEMYVTPDLESLTGTASYLSGEFPEDAYKAIDLVNRYGLTKRKLQILQCLGDGCSNKEIAERLRLAEGTIKVHVSSVFNTLNVSSRLDAVRKALRLGLITQRDVESDI